MRHVAAAAGAAPIVWPMLTWGGGGRESRNGRKSGRGEKSRDDRECERVGESRDDRESERVGESRDDRECGKSKGRGGGHKGHITGIRQRVRPPSIRGCTAALNCRHLRFPHPTSPETACHGYPPAGCYPGSCAVMGALWEPAARTALQAPCMSRCVEDGEVSEVPDRGVPRTES